MLTAEQIKEGFQEQWQAMLEDLLEGKGFNASIQKAAGQFYQQMGAPEDHGDMMLAMWQSCPVNIQKDIVMYVAKNNEEKILPSMLDHIQENSIEVNVPADIKGWIEYFFCIAMVGQLTKVAEKMK